MARSEIAEKRSVFVEEVTIQARLTTPKGIKEHVECAIKDLAAHCRSRFAYV
jgi:hypothetical protein